MHKKIFSLLILITAIIIASKINVNANGAAALIIMDSQRQDTDNSAAIIHQAMFSPKVFRNAEKFLKEKFPKIEMDDWQAIPIGFKINCANKFSMVLKWNGSFVVYELSFFQSGKILYTGDWTQWR